VVGSPDVSNSQHPGNNIVKNAAYDAFPQSDDTDFARGEALVAGIYEALRANPEVFEQSVLLITYDEHGGFYDHRPPPTDVPAPGDPSGRSARLLHAFYRRKAATFDFTILGPRVPAVIVSPYIRANTIDHETHDHACVPATLRRLFAPDAEPLTERDRWAAAHPFDACLTLDRPRTDLPDLSEHVGAPRPAVEPAPAIEVPGHYADFAAQAAGVARHLQQIEETEAAAMTAVPSPEAPLTRQLADETTRAFAEAADRHRAEAH
jgi:phospholipase C